MSINNDFCDREDCKHNRAFHPDNGKCQYCKCVGFFHDGIRNDPIAAYYAEKLSIIHSSYDTDLDVCKYILENFSTMSNRLFQEKQKDMDKYRRELHKKDPELSNRVNKRIINFNKFGDEGMKDIPLDELHIFNIIVHDGANHQGSIILILEMLLSFLVNRFRNFIKELLILVYTIEIKFKNKHKSLTIDQIEHESYDISENDIGDLTKKIRKKWGVDLKKQKNYYVFREFFFRRDMYIHNNGYPNDKYRKGISSSISNNKKLTITSRYISQFIEISNCFSEILFEHFMEKECNLVNINKKSNSIYVDLRKNGGTIITSDK